MQLPKRKLDKRAFDQPDYQVTVAKFEELETRLKKMLKQRPALASEVKRLAELGDFSENAEYQLAKGRLRGLNYRILETENLIKRAEIIVKPKNNNKLQIGHQVKLKMDGVEKEYLILGSSESYPEKGVISHLSPIGQALLGKCLGESIELQIGKKHISCQIIDIT